MRIGLVTSQPLSESMGTSTTILGFASALADLGQEVHILTPGEKTRQLKTNLFIHGYGGSVSSLFYRQFMRLYGSPSIAGKTVLRPRVIKTVVNNFAKLISKWLTTVDLDIVEGEQEIAAAACLKATRRNGPPSIAHFHNVWFEECSELGLLKNGDPGLKFLQEMTYDLL